MKQYELRVTGPVPLDHTINDAIITFWHVNSRKNIFELQCSGEENLRRITAHILNHRGTFYIKEEKEVVTLNR